MYEDLANIHYYPIWNYRYAKCFQDVKYKSKTLSDSERKQVVAIIDETIALYSQGLTIMQDDIEAFNDSTDDFHLSDRTVASIMLFVLITTIDSMVASKYFILADKDYDRRFMRGKLRVILNEGFKRLYGFDEKTYKKSEWYRLHPLMEHFPEVINHQYQELTSLLEKHALSSSWWKEERNLETHLDAEKLFASRQEEIIESQVIMDSMKLLNTLTAVSDFLGNVHTCLFNYLVGKYKRGEITE